MAFLCVCGSSLLYNQKKRQWYFEIFFMSKLTSSLHHFWNIFAHKKSKTRCIFGFESGMLVVVFHAIRQAKKSLLIVFLFLFPFFFFLLGQERCDFKGIVVKESIFATWTSWNWKNHNCGGNYLARSEKRIKYSCMCCLKHCCRQHCWTTCSSQVCWFPNVRVSKLKFGI